MSINRQEFTNVGRDMLGRANNGEHLTFTHIVIGSGRAGAPSDLWPLDELPPDRLELNVPITQQVDQGDGILILDCVFRSNDPGIAAPFQFREIGAMAHIDNEAPRLYCIANVLGAADADIDTIDPANPVIYAWKIKVVIDRAPNVTIVIGESRDILAENIGPVSRGPGWFESKVGNTLRFKRAIEGEGIELTEDAETVTIAQRILRVDLDLYVPENHPDAPGPEVAFPTIQAALNYLKPYVIPPNRLATIYVHEWVTNVTQSIVADHPQGSQIRIIGTLGAVHNIISVANPTGVVQRDYRVNVTVGGVIDIAAGDWVTIEGVQALNQVIYEATINNVFQVAAVAGQVVTIIFRPDSYNAVLVLTGITNRGTLTRLRTVLNVTAGVTAFDIRGLGLLENFAIIGSGAISGTAIQIESMISTRCRRIGIADFIGPGSSGIKVLLGSHFADFVHTSNCDIGIYVPEIATITCDSCFCSFAPNPGNVAVGFYARTGGRIKSVNYSGSFYTRIGFYAIHGSTILIGFGGANFFRAAGAWARGGAVITGTGPSNIDFRFWTAPPYVGSGIAVSDFGIFCQGEAPAVSYNTLSNTANTVGAHGIIQVVSGPNISEEPEQSMEAS